MDSEWLKSMTSCLRFCINYTLCTNQRPWKLWHQPQFFYQPFSVDLVIITTIIKKTPNDAVSLWHHNARVNSHQRRKQTRNRVFHLWCTFVPKCLLWAVFVSVYLFSRNLLWQAVSISVYLCSSKHIFYGDLFCLSLSSYVWRCIGCNNGSIGLTMSIC